MPFRLAPRCEMTVTGKEIPFGSYPMLFDLAGKAEHFFRTTFSPK